MTDPFLTFFTRCCRRPEMLVKNIASVAGQRGGVSVEQLLVVDREGRGLRWANERFHVHRDVPRGEYIYPLDDDLWLDDPGFCRAVRKAARSHDHPDVLLVRVVQRAPYWRVLPPAEVWDIPWESGARPSPWVGAGTNVVVKTELWRPNTWRYHHGQDEPGSWKTGGDWHFITGILSLGVRVVRLDVFGTTGDRHKGVTTAAPRNWFEQATASFCPARVEDGVWRIEHG